jgi:hypothetical protein
MEDKPLVAFIKKILFQKIGWQSALTIIYVEITIIVMSLFFRYPLDYKNPIPFGAVSIIYVGILVLYFTITGISLFISYYSDFKKHGYGKVKLPDIKNKTASGVGFDEAAWRKEVEGRLEVLEKINPTYLALYAIFLTITIGIAFMVIAKIIK